jgi:hypothetical protein
MIKMRSAFWLYDKLSFSLLYVSACKRVLSELKW